MNFIENESAAKLRGGYYTPPDIAAFLARWVIAGGARRILEPSCGDGAFVRAIAEARPAHSVKIQACELDALEAEKARAAAQLKQGVAADVHQGDFLAWVLPHLLREPEFDAAIGNPPFIRYQYLPESMQDRAEKLIRHFHLPFTRHTNAWVPFVVAALARLRPGGRLAMVVPAELLHVLHADSARRYLLSECSRIVVVDPEQIWFEDTLQGVVLLLAEKRETPSVGRGTRAQLAIVRTRGRDLLAQDPGEIFEHADFVAGAEFGSKWTAALMSASERRALSAVAEHAAVRRFRDVAAANVGIVTGANNFFLVTDDVMNGHELGPYAHPMFGRSEHVPGVVYDAGVHETNRRSGHPTNFVWFSDAPATKLTRGAERYIRGGEAQGLHKRFKCRVRTPWYAVPYVYAAPIAMLKRSHDYPRLVLNTLNAYTTDTAYRVTPREIAPSQLVSCFVNSLTALSAELEGRHYGGGVLELVPSEIGKLLVPLAKLDGDALAILDLRFRRGTPAEELLACQDGVVLGALGVSSAMQRDLHGAWNALRHRRQRTAIDH